MMRHVSRNRNRAGLFILLPAMLGLLAGCGIHKPFELFDENTVIKNGTIAVVSANGADSTMRLAETLTRELAARSTFKVWSQAKVGLRMSKYPVAIKEGQPEDPLKPVWFSKGEKSKLDAIQARLKVHYLFVVWTGLSRTGTSASYHMSVNGNVLEYPKGRVIGYSLLSSGSRSATGDDVSRMLKESAAAMADNFIRAAKAEKPVKKN